MSAAVFATQLGGKTLVLNRSYLPIHVTSVRRAFSLLYRGVARAVDEEYRTFDFQDWSELSTLKRDAVGLVGGFVRIPRVILLVTFDRVPRREVRELRPQAPFRVVETDQRIAIDPRSYGRYDAVAAVFASLDSSGSAALYRRLEPLVAEAYGELGNRELSFEEALGRAIHQVLSTPLVVGEAELAHHVNRYVYLDPELEDLSRAQKQLLRMGPANLRRVQAKLRALAEVLEIGGENLPPPVRHEVVSSSTD